MLALQYAANQRRDRVLDKNSSVVGKCGQYKLSSIWGIGSKNIIKEKRVEPEKCHSPS
jgi:hypothetical protein